MRKITETEARSLRQHGYLERRGDGVLCGLFSGDSGTVLEPVEVVTQIIACPYSPNCSWQHEGSQRPSEPNSNVDALRKHRDLVHPLGYEDPTPWAKRGGI